MNQDKQLLEDFLGFLVESELEISGLDNAEITAAVSAFMASPQYIPVPATAISVTSLPAPHFNDGKITL